MSRTIEGVPTSLTREQYIHLIESVGFTASRLRSLEFAAEGIYAEVIEFDAENRPVFDDTRGEARTAVNRVFIPVDGEQPKRDGFVEDGAA